MAYINFVTPYKPIVCGIADYSHFVARECSPDTCDILSFNLDNYGVPLCKEPLSLTHPVQYIIPSREDFSSSSILKGLTPRKNQALWFQHEFGIWRDNTKFIRMLKGLSNIKIVSLHSVHFQSSETIYGLRREEYSFLYSLLPNVDAITVFSLGAYDAVISAFPEFGGKVYILKHGIHLYPEIAGMSRAAAKKRIHEYLIHDSGLDQTSKNNLIQQGIFLDPDTIIIGGAGFITASKGSELLCEAHNRLQQILPEKKIAAVHAGFLRDVNNDTNKYAVELKTRYDGKGQFLLDTYLPENILPIFLRALDIYFYWPSDCTQSGILSHALGTGAVIACRNMEGVGETVKTAGGLSSENFNHLVNGIGNLIRHPELRTKISREAFTYAKEYSWCNQSRKHFQLVEQLYNQPAKQLSLITPIHERKSTKDVMSSILSR